MALPPHPLDDVFDNPNCFKGQFVRSDLLRTALAEAKAEFVEKENGPPVMGPSPSQAARQAFLIRLKNG